ncbi:hypothetical protein [Cryptosporangium phraense]|uniref:DUF559 domain-containing protein n=1 Tax=Cryptosporangium phraense TaxID=2593070 RepID=A0A545AIW4_9ACTN|nr:hypothetical protein [Cryptosporangium phraense]TQS41267.1 hypothetical protein FL583_30585 [Cryptosporangium phraense]
MSDKIGWPALAQRQAGAISRAQLFAHGVTRATISAHLVGGRWQRPIPGVLVTFTGPLPAPTREWVALLHAGEGALLSHRTAGALWRLLPERARYPIHVLIPADRRVRSRRGIVVHRTRVPAEPVGSPPRTGAARTAIDLCARAKNLTEIAGILGQLAQCQPDAIETARNLLAVAPTLPRRADIAAVLDDVAGGAHSALEWHYLVDVERAHGLPTGDRQRPLGGSRQDVHHREYRTTVELDGRVVHQPSRAAWHDRARDNAAASRGEMTLRYGWADVRDRPCAVAAEVAAVLRVGGWPGGLRRCGSVCRVS